MLQKVRVGFFPGYIYMPVRVAPDAVIDAGPLSIRIGLAGSETFTSGPPLPEASMEAALRALCEEAAIDLTSRPVCVTESAEQRHGGPCALRAAPRRVGKTFVAQ